MIRYKLASSHPTSHFAEIEMHIDGIDTDEIVLELPSWRPGRYEIQNFAKNIRRWNAYNSKNEMLAHRKTSKDTWQVSTEGANEVVIRYEYFCEQADAGACWIDENQIYINPVHCFLFMKEKLHEEHVVELVLPLSYKIATSLKKNQNTLTAANYHELVDSPFIASAALQSEKYTVNGIDFYIWFQGVVTPDWNKIVNDFEAFTRIQFNTMGSFPFDEYHFLIQVLPFRFYHGVEHLKSTVLALGPGSELMRNPLYIDFTGVASHELFHAWNIKTIRPAEMHPYDYKNENYSRLGFVYEGVTTYYGDLFLAKCGVYSVEQFFIEIGARLQKHFDNYGRFNLSVADSSFDTWLDGYNPGIPGRKVSIYDEGSLIAMMCDLMIRRKTNLKSSLDDVMRTLYNDFGKKNIGYTDHDYISIVENVAGQPMADFFLDYVYGTENDEKLLMEVLSYAGCELVKKPSSEDCERYFGFKTNIENGITYVTAIAPGSPAFNAGISRADEIVAVNELKVQDNLPSLLKMFSGEKVVITLITSMKILKDVTLAPTKIDFYNKYFLSKKDNADPSAKQFFKAWLNHEFEEATRVDVM
jgi:predicted metalloprotease with PDZ domain